MVSLKMNTISKSDESTLTVTALFYLFLSVGNWSVVAVGGPVHAAPLSPK